MSEYIMDGNKYVQELVRCKDCYYWISDDNATGNCVDGIPLNGYEVYVRSLADDYCSYGERKDNER